MPSHGYGSGSGAGIRGATSRDHVLGRFAPRSGRRRRGGESGADAAELFVAEGIAPVMNRFNRKEDKERQTKDAAGQPIFLLAPRP